MAAKNSKELMEVHAKVDFQTRFTQLFTLNFFFQKLIFTNDLRISPEIKNFIVLSESGKSLYAKLKDRSTEKIEDHNIFFSIFLEFYQSELLVDVMQTDIERISSELTKQILDRKILVPWIYDRLLYDRYFEVFDANLDTLSNEDTIKLLDNTPVGVFQIGTKVIGPFGILESSSNRFISPPPFHCTLALY